jgi:hypothetical protein
LVLKRATALGLVQGSLIRHSADVAGLHAMRLGGFESATQALTIYLEARRDAYAIAPMPLGWCGIYSAYGLSK